jgi:PAS domain S-box-containing protein
MMLNLAGYQTTNQLYAGTRTEVYRGIRTRDNQPAIVKVLRNPHPNFNELLQFRNQYTIARHLSHANIVQPLALERYGNGYALVMPDQGAIALKDYWQQRNNSLSEFLNIAIQLADVLHYLNRERIIHKDIKPANILICPQTHQVKLIDFSISTLLPKEEQQLTNPNVLEGTLAYISPEQTGRMNRGIDYRTDFYSLGVTFYELLMGQLPFSSDDPMELVHCHIAKTPTLGNHSGTLPPVLANIVLKLMAKNAEDRYQSALGLKHDLEQCLHQLETIGEITPFKIGQRDLCDRFIIPEKLYGREAEVRELLDAFERVAEKAGESESNSELMLVSGFSGIGKTAVINEIHKPLVKQRGYFIKGKFDQFNRNMPLSALVQAFQELMAQLLCESDQSLSDWKHKILKAIGENGQLIIDVIPTLENIIGSQPSVRKVSGIEAQNRFNLLFRKFIQLFTKKEHPLTIFLDDLQWADSASLNLLKLLMSESAAGYLLILGAYRDNEVFPAHPLMLTLAELQKYVKINTLTLAPLSQDNITRLVADTLLCQEETAAPLADLVYQKTKGNPFFTIQFLKGLHQDGWITFNPTTGYWECDLTQVRQLALTDDVVEFMVGRLRKLPETMQNMLKLSACIGNRFDLATLAVVCEQTQEEVALNLWTGLQEGLIIPESQNYKFFQGDDRSLKKSAEIAVSYQFLHDRVQQAAYTLIPESQKQKTHYHIGCLLREKTILEVREERIFELVNQLNYGTALIAEQTERDELAQLNLMAGRKARAATAYQAAREYATVGLQLLGADAWQRQYDMTLCLHDLAAEVVFLMGDFEQMDHLIEAVIHHGKTSLDQIQVYQVRIQALVSRNQFVEAIAISQSVLRMLGVNLPAEPTLEDIWQVKQEIDALIGDRSIESLLHLPKMTDPQQLAIMQIAARLTPVCYMTGTKLYFLIVAMQVKWSLQFGNSPVAAFCYAGYGLQLKLLWGDMSQVRQFGQLGYQFALEPDAKNFRAATAMIIGAYVESWMTHLPETLPILLDGYQAGLETGSLEFMSYDAVFYCSNAYWSGQPLTELEPQIRAYYQQLCDLNQLTGANCILVYWQAAQILLGQSEEQIPLRQDAYEEKILDEAKVDFLRLCYFYAYRLTLNYWLEDFVKAEYDAEQTRKYLSGMTGNIVEAVFYFYDSLILLATSPELIAESDPRWQRMQENQAKLKEWADYAPMNHLHKYHLVEAEYHRVLGEKWRAIELYDRAIAGAKENEYLQEEALANELAAKFYLDWGKEKIAQVYMTDAYYCYAKWGAVAKVQDLENEYPQLLKQLKQQAVPKTIAEKSTQTTIVKTTLGTSGALDLATVMKASLAISSEIVLDKLLGQLINILLENAGAEKAFLFLKEKGELGLAASTQVNEEARVHQPLVSVQSSVTEPGDLKSVNPTPYTLHPTPSPADLPLGVINYVQRTGSHVMLGDARTQGFFTNDPYITAHQVKSLLCAPIIKGSKLVGIIYLENNLTTGAFTSDRLKVLQLLSGQAAISLELARSVNEVQNTLAYLKSIINNIADGLLVTDRKGRITQYNPALCQMFGLASPASLGGQHCHEALTVEIGTLVTQTLNNPKEVLSAEINLTPGRIGGAVATAITTDKSAEVIGCAIIIRDITAEKEIDRMKTDFISTVSHELRTPLTSVVGFAKIIHKKLAEQITPALDSADKKTLRSVRQIGDNINIIISEGERLTTLINDVLDIAKMEAGKIEWAMQQVNLGEIIDRAVNTTSSLWQTSGLELIKQVPPERPTVNGDPARLLQVLINLISNAVKFTNQGSITITAAPQLSPHGGSEVIVSVIDTGIGIAPENREKVFEKFKQVGEVMTDKPQGTGLGLPICQQIIEHHQGRIWVESELGVGSNFSFALPLISSNIQAPENLNLDTLVRQLKQSIVPKSSESKEEQKTILVVDDEPSIRSLLRQQLEDQGYIVKEAADGMEAISQVKQMPPDLIILDVMMPAINGFDVAAVLKNNPTTMDIPIIILSIVEDKQRGWKLGIDRYLTKPIDSDKLLNNIEVLISRGASPKKVMVVDRDVSAIKTLTEVLQAKGYSVVEALSGSECIHKALAEKPDMIIVDSVMSQQHDLVKTLRFEKGLENVLFVLLADRQDENLLS